VQIDNDAVSPSFNCYTKELKLATVETKVWCEAEAFAIVASLEDAEYLVYLLLLF